MPIAQVKTSYATGGAVSSRVLTYIHVDHLNTPRSMTYTTKKMVWRWEHDAFGMLYPQDDPDGDGVNHRLDLGFPGQIRDVETSLFYNINRYYDPVMGRYTQSDPIGLDGGLNTYGYVLGNPVNNIDPSGLKALPDPPKKKPDWWPPPLPDPKKDPNCYQDCQHEQVETIKKCRSCSSITETGMCYEIRQIWVRECVWRCI